MRRLFVLFTALAFSLSLIVGTGQAQARYWQDKADQTDAKTKGKPKKKPKLKKFAEVKKDYDKEVKGLFNFFIEEDENKVLMTVNEDQLDKIFLCSMTRSSGDGAYYDAGAQTGYFPFHFHRVGDNLQMMATNLLVRADSGTAMGRAVDQSMSHSIFANTKVLSLPDSSGNFLIDPSDLFVNDVPNVTFFLGQQAKTGFRFDPKNSNFGEIKSFPENSEIDVRLHYSTNKPSDAMLPSPYSIMLKYHYSLSTLPTSDFQARIADDRLGHFLTMYQDYSELDNEEVYVRYVNRWSLKKKDPNAEVSEPEEPIVYWIENTTPAEYIPAVKAGLEYWNEVFERAVGIKNAIDIRVMPDTATWDPADVRYSTIRWFVLPGAGYAVGPSRANPFTGEIYDADVRISADFVRHMFNYADRMIEPINNDPTALNDVDFEFNLGDDVWGHLPPSHLCDYGQKAAMEAAEAMAILDARNTLADKPELTKKFVNQYITELVSHEVGHTLGLRHNFKASTIYTRDQQADPSFTANNGVVGTVMEYAPPNLVPDGQPQADFYTMTPAPYDLWVIEYAYKEFPASDKWDEYENYLAEIASRCGDPKLAYGTDEDAFGNSPRAIDPYATQFDLGSDPLVYWNTRCDLSNELWSKIEPQFEKPGNNYEKLRNVFNYGWGAFSSGGQNIARFIGGYNHHRGHVGDPNVGVPFDPIPAAKQQEAMDFLINRIWAEDVFDFDPELLNKLQPERMPDFNFSVYQMSRVDYPIHAQVASIQTRPLAMIYNPITLARINDIELHYAGGEDVYEMTEIFQDVRRAIWKEAIENRNVNSFRRNLQRAHLDMLVNMVTKKQNPLMPEDAITLARHDLRTIRGALQSAVDTGRMNTISAGHYRDSIANIDAALEASIEREI